MLAIPDPFQTPVGLKSRWCTLQAAINKFSGCVKQIKHHPQKGFCPYFLLQNPGNAPKWIEYITNLQNKLASQKQKSQDTTTTIACLSEPPSHALLTTESSTRKTERPSGQKKSKNNQQRTETWQQALARSQKEMVEQTQLQNDLLSSQTKAMNSIAEDLRLMVEDSFMSKDYSHMDEQTQRYYELKKTSTFEQYGIN
ncbi:hypothetical protein PCASD_06344 [Puccinia coronata f. sp. avenae]|uniref:No apical meristem-associated C-terminal domain-containing protein n=1 Tax=Puccinia coronata f. sp. avenae TaxID=200324 RepID=A0A2N5V900_9BASI|nr:hypothetical protein PCASD_06344 [Puccinia coronata f. sp. avenae]